MHYLFRNILFLLLVSACTPVIAQSITGRITGDGGDTEVLPGAVVRWAGTALTSTTDTDGRFSIGPPAEWPAALVSAFVGYRNDTLFLDRAPTTSLTIRLSSSVELKSLDVVDRVSGTRLDPRSTISTEIIGQKELKRAACCDLSESFETNATVDVSFSDAVSGAKTIRMLGLDGKYAQMSMENIPFIRGLSVSSGLTLIPGTWINEINLSKGVGTAVNGPNAMTGQIDLCLLNPLAEGPLFVNLYANSQGRAELNVHTAQPTGKSSANLLMVHGNWFDREMDQNKDGFMDAPRTRRINVMDRWMYQGERKSGQVGLRVVVDERDGGQTAMQSASDAMPGHGDHGPYTIKATNRIIDGFGKHGWVFENDPTKSIGLIASLRRHEVSNAYGLRTYEGLQQSAYASMVYQQLLGSGTDQIKAGFSFQYDDYEELFTSPGSSPGQADTVPTLELGRTERMPGVFAEHTLKRERFILVSGFRVDVNDLYGTVASPRVHAKYDIGELTNLRASIGHGFRTANPLVENAGVMASSRTVLIDPLDMERAWNFGVSILHKFKWLDRKWAIGVDAYHTRFTEQVVTDMDRDPRTLAIYMLDGPSYSSSLLADLQVDLTRTVQFRTSYRFYDVRTTYDDRLLWRPFIPAHRGLLSLAYADIKERWRFDITLQLFGESRIPSTASNPEEYRFLERAPAYSTMNAQVTRTLGAWEIYLGSENITSVIQQQQIIAADDPYGPYFDASLIWGPTNKAMIYGGFRYAIARKKTGT